MRKTINPSVRKPIVRVLAFGIAVAWIVIQIMPHLPLEALSLKLPATTSEILNAWAIFICFLLVLSWAITRFKYLEFGEENLFMQSGIIGIKQIRIPYSRVTHTEFRQSILDRFLGIGTLRIDTAGTSAVEMVFEEIVRKDAMEVIEFVEKKSRESGKYIEHGF
jgi:putative membrane protein